MKNASRISIFQSAACFALILALNGCTAPTADLMAPPLELPIQLQEGGELQVSFRPKVRLLIVFDDTRTMTWHSRRLIPQMERLFEELSASQMIDLKVGFTSVWDSIRFQTASNPNGNVPMIASKSLSGIENRQNFYPLGELIPLRDPEGSGLLSPEEKSEVKRFVSRPEGSSEILSTTLREQLWIKCHEFYHPSRAARSGGPARAEAEANTGVSSTEDRWVCDLPEDPNEGQGAEFEEIFTPIRAVFENCYDPSHPNYGFCEPDDYTVVLIVTDAEDGSPNINAQGMAQFLRDHTGQRGTAIHEQRFSVFGITYPASAPDRRGSCRRDFAGPAIQLERFFELVGAKTFDICSDDYSSMVDQIIEDVQKAAIGQLISLGSAEAEFFEPEQMGNREPPKPLPLCSGEVPSQAEGLHWIRVCYGSEEVPHEFWSYNETRNAVRIKPKWRPQKEVGARFRLLFTPIDYRGSVRGDW